MGTSAALVIKLSESSWGINRVNWDGYPSGVGKELKTYFNTHEQATRLLDNDEIRSLEGGQIEHYNEDASPTRYVHTEQEAFQYADLNRESYTYYWDLTRWYLRRNGKLVKIPKDGN
jgi:hypothetical protein